MTQINWNALQSFDIGGAFNQGMQAGQQRRREQETDNALRALVANPNDPNVVQNLAQYDPRMAMQVQQQQSQQAQQQQLVQTRRAAAGGDAQALMDLAGVAPDEYFRFDEQTRKGVEKGIEVIGQAALMADTPEKWDATVQQLGPEFAQYMGRFDLREGVVSKAKLAKEFIDINQPKYQVIPEGGMLVNTRDPQALAQVGAGGPAPLQQPAQGGVSEEQAAPIIQQAMTSKVIAPEDLARIQSSLGPNGQQAAQQWMRQQGIQVGKQIGGKTYVQRNGEWYEAGGNQ
ncbi:hypothetical protein [Sphingopyxis witflariensis]|uniref:Uncharacterized protein n=1 Tax=Sphingopyxis witflariensis TaxID=173675 RepID=A0A246JY54_9SPHN|nr:hypothetical protein [Sphingopyxis witflariensis]OWQ98022.1 hypothetical protein CDQ91_10405 [Sphingopyxis witflariensis]